MRNAVLLLSALACAGCSSLTPPQYAAQVAALPGRQPLRVGVVVLGTERALPPAFVPPPAAPGGAAPQPLAGAVYAPRSLPESLPADEVVDALRELGAFTDLVQLPFDPRGIASRAAVVQRVQDRVWPTAQAQELDALLVVEGVRDGGLRYSDEGESVFSLDTVLWWLAWPFGLWIHDRDYRPDCELVATMFWLGDVSSYPEPEVVSASAAASSLAPWDRASAPLLGLVLPPAWLADDAAAVATAVCGRARAMLPIELARLIKASSPVGPDDVDVALRRVADRYELSVSSRREVARATVVSLPRGALADTADVEAVDVALTAEIELTNDGPRHAVRGALPRQRVDRAGRPLVRLRVELGSGAVVSRTWAIDDLAP